MREGGCMSVFTERQEEERARTGGKIGIGLILVGAGDHGVMARR